MRKRKDSINGVVAPVLNASTLSVIHELNSDYLELLIADRELQRFACWLPLTVIAGLAELHPAARRALAACPFALYSLGIEHQDFWRAANDSGDADENVRYRLPTVVPAESCFGMSALFFAWHVATVQRMAAKVFFAMPDFAVDGLVRMRPWELQRIAASCFSLMRPRWPMNSAFWPDLVRFAARGDLERLNTTQLLGSQLMAADLRIHAAPRSVMRSFTMPSTRVSATSIPIS